MIKNILFDLDDTIFDFLWSEKNALSKTLIHFNIKPEERILSRYSEINLSQWKLLEQGKITRDELKIKRYIILFDEMNIKECSAEAAADYYENALGTFFRFMPGAEEVLKRLSLRFRLYIVTNGTAAVQNERIKRSGISRYTNDIFISEITGYEKPQKEFFEKCFSTIPDFSKEETLIVGDSISSDIRGGINAGIKTIWFNHKHEKNSTTFIPDFEISELEEIESITNKL
ncbi:MAG: YjjG family noncanonical pyrimidine nucleotidase [Clostridia bacterium]|nr:YjjG family noncanonical pyrimidine nucleotidase [Clostridia bacterium]